MIAKLDSYRFDNISLKLIHSYLSDKFQKVRLNLNFISLSKILIGVLQGSIFGPDLFKFGSNDLFLFLPLDICNLTDATNT